jgi:hypothetical protein
MNLLFETLPVVNTSVVSKAVKFSDLAAYIIFVQY